LPGLNCAACGFPNCNALARAIVRGEAAPSTCPVGGNEAAAFIALRMGLKAEKLTKKIAVVHCGADANQKERNAEYTGIKSCKAAEMIFWGGLKCKFGCLGFGDCESVCPFDAIKTKNGLARVDPEKCTACGKCVTACPRGIISLGPFEKKELTFVACSSGDKGAIVRKICPVGCIGCKACEKLTNGVFYVTDNLARVNYAKAKTDTNWAACIEKCPTKTIQKIKGNRKK